MLDGIVNNSPLLYLTQSLWRDEVYSIFVSQKPIAEFIGKLSFEPPFYYILLHYWMKIFGTSEIATRSLSFLGFFLATILVVFYAERRFGKHWLAYFAPIFYFLNPMLLYYAFEVRTYGWYIFFSTAAIISYLEKRWIFYTLSIILGFYTHAYMIIVPFVSALHYVFINWKLITKNIKEFLVRDPMIRSLLTYFILIGPWLYIIVRETTKLQKSSWYFPVDLNLIRSVLGNMFVGYEGTPWFGWKWTALLSVALLLCFLFAIQRKKERDWSLYHIFMIFVPLTVVISISFLKPLFVNRYLIPVTIAEVFLLLGFIEYLPKQNLQRTAAVLFMSFVLFINIWYPKHHTKTPSRDMMQIINSVWDEDDVVLATSPLVLFEAQYYSSDPKRVFLYNPSDSPFPWYVGDFIVDPSVMVRSIPEYPIRAFLVNDSATFEVKYRIFRSLGDNVEDPLIQ